MDDKQIRGIINNYVGHYLLYAKISVEQADRDGAKKIGDGLVKSLGELGEAEIVKRIIGLAVKTNWGDIDGLESFQKDYMNVMQGNVENAGRY